MDEPGRMLAPHPQVDDHCLRVVEHMQLALVRDSAAARRTRAHVANLRDPARRAHGGALFSAHLRAAGSRLHQHTTHVTSPDASSSKLGWISPVKTRGPAAPTPPAGGGFAEEGWGAPPPASAPPLEMGPPAEAARLLVLGLRV